MLCHVALCHYQYQVVSEVHPMATRGLRRGVCDIETEKIQMRFTTDVRRLSSTAENNTNPSVPKNLTCEWDMPKI